MIYIYCSSQESPRPWSVGMPGSRARSLASGTICREVGTGPGIPNCKDMRILMRLIEEDHWNAQNFHEACCLSWEWWMWSENILGYITWRKWHVRLEMPRTMTHTGRSRCGISHRNRNAHHRVSGLNLQWINVAALIITRKSNCWLFGRNGINRSIQKLICQLHLNMPDITTQAALATIGGKGGGQACFQQHFSHVARCDALALALPIFRCFNIYIWKHNASLNWGPLHKERRVV